MKTLIFNGSPRLNGDTSYLTEALRRELPGEVREIRAYREKIRPCVDCRRCWQKPGCVIPDDMQEIYRAIQEADCIIIASPVYFSGLTGVLMAMMSRLQMFYTARRFLHTELIEKPKAGGVILAGGGEGAPKHAESTARMLLRGMKVTGKIPVVATLATDTKPAREDAEAIAEVKAMAAQILAQIRENHVDISG